MTSRGRGRRGSGQSNNQPPPAFNQQAYMGAIGAATTTITQASATVSHGGSSNLQRFKAHHPLTFWGGGDPMIAYHWFRQVDKILEAMEITSDATKMKLEGESQVWWDWIKASRDLEAITLEEFHWLFMEKYFPASVRHAKAWEFLELRQGTMTILEYMAKFTELARFADDYVATNMAKVRKFEDGLKLSIRGKIVGLLLQDIESMVRITMAIEREVYDARNIRDTDVIKDKGNESQLSSSG